MVRLAGLLYLLGHRFPSLVDPPGDRLRAPASTGTGPYAFMATTPDGQPVAYSSCRPIDYVVNPAGMPPEGPRLIADAIGQVSAATGLKFTDEGETSEPPSERRPVRQLAANPAVRGAGSADVGNIERWVPAGAGTHRL